MSTNKNKKGFRAWTVLFWLAVWQAVSMMVGRSLFFVSPWQAAKTLITSMGDPRFWEAVLRSSGLILLGMLGGTLAGVMLAALAAWIKPVEELLAPLVHLIKSVPVVSYIVLALICLSSRGLSRLLAFLVVLPVIYTNVLEAAKRLDREKSEMARVFHFRMGDKIRYVILPQVFPSFLAAFSVAAGTAWKAGIAAEVIGMPPGTIGERIQQAKIYLETDRLFAWTFVVIAASFLMEKGSVWLLAKGFWLSQRTRWGSFVPEGANDQTKPLNGEPRADKEAGVDIVLDRLTKAYGDKIVLNSLTRRLAGGKTTVLMAPSGWGKTTLMRLIAGLEPASEGIAAVGNITVGNIAVRNNVMGKGTMKHAASTSISSGKDDKNVFPELRMVFQEDRLLGHLDALSNVALANPGGDAGQMLSVLIKAGLDREECTGKPVETFSGGMQRRVSLVRALVSRAGVLLLDEPFTGLDQDRKEEMMELSRSLWKGKTVLIATHDEHEALALGDWIWRPGCGQDTF